MPSSALFPLANHNGRYEWAFRLAKQQAHNGHQVTMYAAPGSYDDTTNIIWKSTKDEGSYNKNNINLMRNALTADGYDIYHSHYDYLHYEFGGLTTKPIVFTQHWFPNEKITDAAKKYRDTNIFAVPPTDYMAKTDDALGIATAGVVKHGIDLTFFKPIANPKAERFIFVGRITANKGVLEAVKLAKKMQQSLDIIGKVNKSDEAYWEQILPLVDGTQITYLGPRNLKEVAAYLANAKALIFPSQAIEAFGQVTIEAQAAGTPVIISDVGASLELVDDKKTGFVVSSPTAYESAMRNISKIDRSYCREFAKSFDIQKMFDEYEALYKSLTTHTLVT